MKEVLYRTRASKDISTAVQWYESQRRGLGFEFLNCLEDEIASIRENPERYLVHHTGFRRTLLKRFPYSIFYKILDKKLLFFLYSTIV